MNRFSKKTCALAVAALVAGAPALAIAGNLIPGASLFGTEALNASTILTIQPVIYSNQFDLQQGIPYKVSFILTGANYGAPAPTLTNDQSATINCLPLVALPADTVAWECTDSASNPGAAANFTLNGVFVVAGAVASQGSILMQASVKSREGASTFDISGNEVIASGTQAVRIVPRSDDQGNGTRFSTTNVNDINGPLFGFLSGGSGGYTSSYDTSGYAKSKLGFDNNSQNAVCPDGTTLFDMSSSCGAYSAGSSPLTLTITDSAKFQALDMPDGLVFDYHGIDQSFSVDQLTGIATLVLTPGVDFTSGDFPQGTVSAKQVRYYASGVASLGTSRTLNASATLDSSSGIDDAMSALNPWWVWNSNGSILYAPFGATAAGWNSRIQLTNMTDTTVQYFNDVYAENGLNTGCTINVAPQSATGTIPANSTITLAVTTATVGGFTTGTGPICSTFTSQRGVTVKTTIAAPLDKVRGAYIVGNPATGSTASYIMHPDLWYPSFNFGPI